MNINLDLYNYFYYVCEFKSITKAANFLYVSQPAITKQIKKLENILGKKLIIRNTRGIELTKDGELLYNEIKTSIEILNSTEASFKEKTDKYDETIKIVAGHSTLKKFLLKSLTEYNKFYPSIKFELSTYRYQKSIQLLREGKVDLIFLTMEEISEKYSNIVFEKFMVVDDIFVVSKDLKTNFPDEIKIIDLNNYPTISLLKHTISRKWLNNYFNKNGLEFKPKYELSSTWLIDEYVSSSVGIGVLVKQHVIDKLNSGELIEIKTDVKLPQRTMAYAYKKDSIKYPIIKEFVEYIKRNNFIQD